MIPPGLEKLFEGTFPEGEFSLTPFGRPPSLQTTFAHNGPGRFSWDDLRFQHWLDGDGMIQQVVLGPNPTLTCRYVRTERWRGFSQGRRFRSFGTRWPGDELLFGRLLANPANVHVQWLDEKLLALGEQGLPIELDERLETVGEYRMGLSKLSPFAAHAKQFEGGWANFGVDYHPQHPCLYTYEKRAGQPVRVQRVPLPRPYCLHDFALHPRYFVFYIAPYELDLEAVIGGQTIVDSLTWEEGVASQVWWVDRRDGTVTRTEVPSDYCLHLINAFDEGGRRAVDLLLYEAPLYGEFTPLPRTYPSVQSGQVTRFSVGRDVQIETLPYTRLPDFPHMAPPERGAPTKRFWGVGCTQAAEPGPKFFNEMVGWDWKTSSVQAFALGKGKYTGGEPLWVEDSRKEQWIVAQVACPLEQRTEYWVWRAGDLEGGPVGGWRAPHLTPLALHGMVKPAHRA